jgi:hypothetical protein
MIVTTAFQNFNLDLETVGRVIKIISNDTNILSDIAGELGMGDRKIRDIFEWCNHMGLLERNPRSSPQVLTTLGSRLVNSTDWTSQLPLLDILWLFGNLREKAISSGQANSL